MRNNIPEQEADTLLEELKIIKKKNTQLRQQYNSLLTSVQHEKETVDHRRLRILTSQNLQLQTQIRYLTKAQNSRSEMVSSLEHLLQDLNRAAKSSKQKGNFENIHQLGQSALHTLRKYRHEVKNSEDQTYLGIEANKFFYNFSPFLQGRSTLDPNSFRDYESFSSGNGKKHNLDKVNKKTITELFTYHNIFLNQIRNSYGGRKLDQVLDGCEVPPFINLMSISAIENKLGVLYQNIVRFLNLSEKMERMKERKIEEVEGENEESEDENIDEEDDLYYQEKRRVLQRVARDLVSLRDEMKELSLIVPPKQAKNRNKHHKKKVKKDIIVGGRPEGEDDRSIHDTRDEFELKFILKKVWTKFFRGGRAEYKSCLKSMVDCYRKQRRLWGIEKQVFKEKVSYLEHLVRLYKHQKTPVVPPKRRNRSKKKKNDGKNHDHEEELKLLKQCLDLSRKVMDNEGLKRLEEMLSDFEIFESQTDGPNLKMFLNGMKRRYGDLKKYFGDILEVKNRVSCLERELAKNREIKEAKKNKNKNIQMLEEGPGFLSPQDLEKEAEGMRLEYEQQEQKNIEKMYRMEESLMKEKMYMKTEPKFVDFKQPANTRSRIFHVDESERSNIISSSSISGKGGNNKGSSNKGSGGKVKLGESKTNSNLIEMKRKRKLIKEKIAKMDRQLSSKSSKTQFQKYAIKKKKALEVAALKRVERTIKELTD